MSSTKPEVSVTQQKANGFFLMGKYEAVNMDFFIETEKVDQWVHRDDL